MIVAMPTVAVAVPGMAVRMPFLWLRGAVIGVTRVVVIMIVVVRVRGVVRVLMIAAHGSRTPGTGYAGIDSWEHTPLLGLTW